MDLVPLESLFWSHKHLITARVKCLGCYEEAITFNHYWRREFGDKSLNLETICNLQTESSRTVCVESKAGKYWMATFVSIYEANFQSEKKISIKHLLVIKI